MFKAVGYNLKHIADFSGREDRPTFWWYVLFLAIVFFVVSFVQGIILAMSMLGEALSTDFDEAQMDRQMIESTIAMIEPQLIIGAIISLALIVLLAAAFVRRLHDGGFSGWVAIIPAAMVIANLAIGYSQLDEIRALMLEAKTAEELEAAAYAASSPWQMILGWLPYIIVAVLGAWPSQKQANKWGEYAPAMPEKERERGEIARMAGPDDRN